MCATCVALVVSVLEAHLYEFRISCGNCFLDNCNIQGWNRTSEFTVVNKTSFSLSTIHENAMTHTSIYHVKEDISIYYRFALSTQIGYQ